MRLDFIETGPALLVEGKDRTLVIADLHFGIEFDLAVHGWHFRSRSRERLNRVIETVKIAGPDRLILLGDVKHGIPVTSRQEFSELPHVLETLRSLVPVSVLPGNHDGGLERFLEPGEMLPVNGACIDGVGYLHGHTYPSADLAGKLIIAGHHHPMVSLKDDVGCALRAPAYLLAPVDGNCLNIPDCTTSRINGNTNPEYTTRVLFMPAFNEFSGIDVLRIKNSPMSPLSKCMLGDRADVFLSDGTFIGSLSRLEGEKP